jgi:hypothetical protein
MHLYLAGNNKILCENCLTDKDIPLLVALLDKNAYIVSLDLRYNNISDLGAVLLAKVLVVSSFVCHNNYETGSNYEGGKENVDWGGGGGDEAYV